MAAENSLHEMLLSDLMSDETFRPAEPHSIEETGLTATLIEDLLFKYVLAIGSASGREIARHLCLPFMILEDTFRTLRSRQLLVHTGSAQLGDYVYNLTEQGRNRAQSAMKSCGYVGPAPVTLTEYVLSVDAQSIRAESPKRNQLEHAFADISINEELFDSLGPAVNSGAGLFLYGEPGNGKTTLARRITSCFGQNIFVPRTVVEDGQLIKVFDAAYHEPVEDAKGSLMKSADHDQRWVRIRRPTVIVGGELTLDNLEIRHDPHTNVSEAPIQMKSNCGCLLIDDFGRQRIEPLELLNRWIVPLENRIDFLTLSTGKKIQIPFEQLIIFSTNLEPNDLCDEAFLRRIPYKIEIGDPDAAEFLRLFESYANQFHCDFEPSVVEWLLNTHYRPHNRAMRRCHPRDLLSQIRNYCNYNGIRVEMLPQYFDRVVSSYFTVVNGVATDSTAVPSNAVPVPAVAHSPAAAPKQEASTAQASNPASGQQSTSPSAVPSNRKFVPSAASSNGDSAAVPTNMTQAIPPRETGAAALPKVPAKAPAPPLATPAENTALPIAAPVVQTYMTETFPVR